MLILIQRNRKRPAGVPIPCGAVRIVHHRVPSCFRAVAASRNSNVWTELRRGRTVWCTEPRTKRPVKESWCWARLAGGVVALMCCDCAHVDRWNCGIKKAENGEGEGGLPDHVFARNQYHHESAAPQHCHSEGEKTLKKNYDYFF